MTEIYEDWLSSKMTRDEYNELTDEEKKERLRLQKRNSDNKYYEKNKEKIKEKDRKYREENPEKEKERHRKYYEANKEKETERLRKYKQTPNGKKVNRISVWTNKLDLQETEEELDRIYELYLYQELCNACDVKLTRDGVCSTQACMDHDHITHRFRHIICRSCNTHDKWKEHFC